MRVSSCIKQWIVSSLHCGHIISSGGLNVAIFQLRGKLWWLKSGLFSLKVGGILIFQSGNTGRKKAEKIKLKRQRVTFLKPCRPFVPPKTKAAMAERPIISVSPEFGHKFGLFPN